MAVEDVLEAVIQDLAIFLGAMLHQTCPTFLFLDVVVQDLFLKTFVFESFNVRALIGWKE